jgi:hypothetical protein
MMYDIFMIVTYSIISKGYLIIIYEMFKYTFAIRNDTLFYAFLTLIMIHFSFKIQMSLLNIIKIQKSQLSIN